MLGSYLPAAAGPTLRVLTAFLAFAATAAAQSVPAAPPAPGFAGKCASCVSGLGGMLSSCKQSCCNSPLGTLINGAFQPLKFATGGVIPSPCPGPNDPSHKPDGGGAGSAGPPGPQQAADAIKQDQAQAKARADAVRYLATVPCHYYPEAEVAIITALRTDRSECVRWEAAHGLAQGCCCTKRTIAALKIVAEGSQKDGNPSEMSMRVRVEAINALQHCLAMCGDNLELPQRPESPATEPETIPTPAPPRRPEVPATYNIPAAYSAQPAQNSSGVQPISYYEEVGRRSTGELLAEARRLIESVQPVETPRTSPDRGKSLYDLWQRATQPPASPTRSVPPSPPPPAAVIAAEPTPAVPLELPHQEPLSRLPATSVLHTPNAGSLATEPAGATPVVPTRPGILGPPQFASPPAQPPFGPLNSLVRSRPVFPPPPLATSPAAMGQQVATLRAMDDSIPGPKERDTRFEPSSQWTYPPFPGPVRMVLRPEWLPEPALDQDGHVWR